MNRWVWVCMLVAAVVRLGAASGLPLDADEPVYLEAAEGYAEAIRSGRSGDLLDQPHNPEHPALVKLIHGVGLVPLGSGASLVKRVAVVRGIEAGCGVLLAGLLAWVHPLAGMAAALHTLHAKYTSQGYLEALPMVLMFLALIAWDRARSEDTGRWPLMCGLALGAAAACKPIHVLPGVVLVVHLGLHRRRVLPMVIGAGFLAAVLLDPGLWADPVGRLVQRLQHHSSFVPDTTQPVWYPLEALGGALPSRWHPDVFFVSADPIWLGLGLWGLISAARRSGPRRSIARMALAWFVVCLGVLMVWPTRWAQHALVLVVPVCLGVGFFAEHRLSRANPRSAPSD